MTYTITDDCVSCAECATECPTEAIKPGKGKYIIDSKTCRSCGICEFECPLEAITAR